MSKTCGNCMNPLVWDDFRKRYVCVNCENTFEESSLNSPFTNY